MVRFFGNLFLYQQKIIFFLNHLQAIVNKRLTELLWNRLAFITLSLPILTKNTFLIKNPLGIANKRLTELLWIRLAFSDSLSYTNRELFFS